MNRILVKNEGKNIENLSQLKIWVPISNED